MYRLKKVFTGILFLAVLTGTAGAVNVKWKELFFTEDVNLGLAELTQYCMLHNVTVSDVLWANSISSDDIKAGSSIYLPENHADLLAIWQHKGAWQKPSALLPLTSAAAAKRAVKAESQLAKPASIPMPKIAGVPDFQTLTEPKPQTVTQAPPPKAAQTPPEAQPQTPAEEPEIFSEAVNESDDGQSNDELIAQLREEVKTDARNLPPAPKDEALPELSAPLPEPPAIKTAKAETVTVKVPEPVPAEKAKPSKQQVKMIPITPAQPAKKNRETPQNVIAKTAKPDKVLAGKPRKSSKQEIPGLMDPIIILSPNGDPSKGPMRLVISGDKVEVVQLPKNAAPKRPSLADLDHTFGTNPSYLPHYNMTAKPRDPFVLNMGNLAGKMLWPVDGKISSPFGKWRGSHKHHGIDIPMPAGTPIRATRNGVISRTGDNSTMGFRGYGNFILMDHGDGLQTFYAHCLSVAVVQGQRVMQGQIIGYAGSTGRSTANHLHFEVRLNNNKVDPVPYMAGNTHLASTK